MVTEIRYASLDDEWASHDVLRVMLAAHPDFLDCGAFLDLEEARACIATSRIDVLFLDIELIGFTGLEFLASLKEPPVVTILVTAHAQHALDAFALGVRDYLLKPLVPERIYSCLDRIRPLVEQARAHDAGSRPDLLPFKVGRSHILRSPDVIAAIDADGNFSRLHVVATADYAAEDMFVSESLKSLEERLTPFGFVRCHKGHMINIRFFRQIDASSVSLSCGLQRPLGRTFRQSLVAMSQFAAKSESDHADDAITRQ